MTIERSNGAQGGFSIQLYGSPTLSRGNPPSLGTKADLALLSSFYHCDIRKKCYRRPPPSGCQCQLAVFECAGPGPKMRFETGRFPGNAATADISVEGTIGRDFDTKALHELLRSVR